MFKPTKNKILVKPRREEVSEGGIVIPGIAQSVVGEGVLIARGPDAEEIPEGAKVLYMAERAFELKADGESYVILVDEDTFGYTAPE